MYVADATKAVKEEDEHALSALRQATNTLLALNKVDTLDQELIDALSAELSEASGFPVLPLSAAGESGIDAVLDTLLERLGDKAELADEEAEEAQPWSPL